MSGSRKNDIIMEEDDLLPSPDHEDDHSLDDIENIFVMEAIPQYQVIFIKLNYYIFRFYFVHQTVKRRRNQEG